MAKSKKLIISETVSEVSPYELETSLEKLRNRFDDWITQYGPNAKFNWDPDNWVQYADSPSPQFTIKVEREETDKEHEQRISVGKAQKAEKENRERQEYERLRKLFGEK